MIGKKFNMAKILFAIAKAVAVFWQENRTQKKPSDAKTPKKIIRSVYKALQVLIDEIKQTKVEPAENTQDKPREAPPVSDECGKPEPFPIEKANNRRSSKKKKVAYTTTVYTTAVAAMFGTGSLDFKTAVILGVLYTLMVGLELFNSDDVVETDMPGGSSDTNIQNQPRQFEESLFARFGDQLSKIRMHNNLSVQDASSQTGISQTKIRNYESGHSWPSEEDLRKLIELYGFRP